MISARLLHVERGRVITPAAERYAGRGSGRTYAAEGRCSDEYVLPTITVRYNM